MLKLENKFSDIDELKENIRDWDLDFKQIDKGSFDFTLQQSNNKNYNILFAQCNKILDQQGSTPKNMKTFALISKDSTDLIWRGKRIFPGDLTLFPDTYELDALSKEGFKVYTISIKNKIFEEIIYTLKIENKQIQNGKAEIFKLSNYNYGKLYNLLNLNINNNYENIDIKYLAELILESTCNKNVEKIDNYNKRINAVNKLRDYLKSNPNENISLYDLCKITGVSKRTLEYAFMEHTSMSPMRYIKNYKLNIAFNLVKNTNKSISEIAVSLGFNHLGYFSFYFKKLFGKNPSSVRKIIK